MVPGVPFTPGTTTTSDTTTHSTRTMAPLLLIRTPRIIMKWPALFDFYTMRRKRQKIKNTKSERRQKKTGREGNDTRRSERSGKGRRLLGKDDMKIGQTSTMKKKKKGCLIIVLLKHEQHTLGRAAFDRAWVKRAFFSFWNPLFIMLWQQNVRYLVNPNSSRGLVWAT